MASPEIQRLRETLERALQGQDDAKAGLLLALVAREHAYLEGPPGCGKSALARALARASGARIAELAFHRDASAAELLGEVHLRREARASLERIAIELSVGPSASAEVLLLDDLSRAPGEALGVLLRVLGQRRLADRALPLETAIATSGPPELENYGDPLEPTQLDRFAFQVRMRGLVGARSFALARALLDRPLGQDLPPPLDTEVRHALQRRAAALPIESSARAALLRAVERLAGVERARRRRARRRRRRRRRSAPARAHGPLRARRGAARRGRRRLAAQSAAHAPPRRNPRRGSGRRAVARRGSPAGRRARFPA